MFEIRPGGLVLRLLGFRPLSLSKAMVFHFLNENKKKQWFFTIFERKHNKTIDFSQFLSENTNNHWVFKMFERKHRKTIAFSFFERKHNETNAFQHF